MKDLWAKYQEKATQLRKSYGYGDMLPDKNEEKEDGSAQEIVALDKPVDFDEEIENALTNFDFGNENSIKALNHMKYLFSNKNKRLIALINLILGDGSNITQLKQIPYVCDAEHSTPFLLAILIQNCQHNKNSDRVKAIEEKRYVEFLNMDQALKFLKETLAGKLKQNLLSLESALIKDIDSKKADVLVERILQAPDMFYAAALMIQNKLFCGKGDLKKFVDILGKRRSSEYKDIANKLVLLKTGHLYHKNE